MWSENKIRTYRRKLKKQLKENENFISTADTTKFIYAYTAEVKKRDNKKLKFEISVLDKVLS